MPSFGGGGVLGLQKSGEASLSTNDLLNPTSLNNPGQGNNTQDSSRAPVQTTTLKGLTPIEALEQYEGELTPFEMTELTGQEFIYTVGSVRVQGMRQIVNREGFYNAHVGEQIGYRYLIEKVIDAGAFGQVVQCIDMKESGQSVAVKISKNKK